MSNQRHMIDARSNPRAEDEFKKCTKRVDRVQVSNPTPCGYFGPRDDVKGDVTEPVKWHLY